MVSSTAGDVRERFQYSPLPSTEHIRILVLQPLKSFGDPIYADVEIVRVSRISHYAALSYSWGMDEDGDASLCRSITIQGVRLAITQNLFEGLQRLLSSQLHSPLRLWVDAICINQSDAQEQSTQVAMMAKIYSNAYRTNIWLGEGREEDGLQAFQIFERLQHMSSDPKEPSSDRVIHAFVASGIGRCRPCGDNQFCACGRPYLPSSMGKDWNGINWGRALFDMLSGDRALLDLFASRTVALACFFNRRYWTRRWVLQEIRQSEALLIHWSQFEIIPRKLQAILDQLKHIFLVCEQVMRRCKVNSFNMWPRRNIEFTGSSLHDARLDLGKRLRHVQDLFSNPSSLDGPPEWTLERLLSLFNEMECSDPRDRLFCMLSLARVNWIKPNYSQSTVKAYTAFAKGLIDHGRASVVFKNVNRHSPSDDISGTLPSWVPDLRERFYDHRYEERRYNSARDKHLLDSGQLNIRFDVNGSLMAEFFFLGTVANFSDPASYFNLVSSARTRPWLGVLGRKTTTTISHKVKFRDDPRSPYPKLPPFSMLRDGDILCTSHGQLPPVWKAGVSGERVILFLRRTGQSQASYSIVYRLGLGELDTTHWDRASERTIPSKITLQLV